MTSYPFLFLLALVGGVAGQTAHTQCSYVEDNLFECDYSALTSSSDRPIDYASFSPEPQRLEVIMNGLVPYYGKLGSYSRKNIINTE